jgi:polysaccharide biosynthesis transport protein
MNVPVFTDGSLGGDESDRRLRRLAHQWPPDQDGVRRDQDPGPEIDLGKFIRELWRRKFLIAAVAAVFTAMGLLMASNMAPTYTASARVLINPYRLNIVDMQQVLDGSRNSMQDQVEIIRSTELLERMADHLELEATAEFNPALRDVTPSLQEQIGAYVYRFLPFRQYLPAIEIPTEVPPVEAIDDEAAAQAKRAAILRRLRNGLAAQPVANSRAIDIFFTSTNPDIAARVANGVADEFIAEQLAVQLEATQSASAWLTEQAEDLQARVRRAESAVQTARAELAQAAGQGAQVAAQQMQVVSAALASARATRTNLEVRLETVSEALQNNQDIEMVPEFRGAALMQDLLRRRASLRDEEVALRAVRTADLVQLRVLQARLTSVDLALRAEAERIAESISSQLQEILREEQALTRQIAELELKAHEQAREDLRVRELEREAEASRRLHESIFSRLNEITVQETLLTPGVRLLSRAEPPSKPGSASKRLVVAMAGALGVFAGIGLVGLLQWRNNTFRTADEVEELTGAPVLATLPVRRRAHIDPVGRSLQGKATTPLAEAVRNLRTSILFAGEPPPSVIMFTSSVPSEGNSAAALLVALASRKAGRSTIIVDCNMRSPSLGRAIYAGREGPCLLSVLEGSATIDDAVVEEPETGLHVLGPRPALQPHVSAADLLTSGRFFEMISSLRERYDLVILDTPPVLMVTDARIVASAADMIVYAVRQERTPCDMVMEGLRQLRSISGRMVGIILVSNRRASLFSLKYKH